MVGCPKPDGNVRGIRPQRAAGLTVCAQPVQPHTNKTELKAEVHAALLHAPDGGRRGVGVV